MSASDTIAVGELLKILGWPDHPHWTPERVLSHISYGIRHVSPSEINKVKLDESRRWRDRIDDLKRELERRNAEYGQLTARHMRLKKQFRELQAAGNKALKKAIVDAIESLDSYDGDPNKGHYALEDARQTLREALKAVSK
jgi:molecular chaperone GrpE (heat shock protein)